MRILELWRYPVSSLGGERLSVATLDQRGIPGDRQFAIVDGETLQPAAPEKLPRWSKLLFLSARSEELDLPEIVFPDGLTRMVDDTHLNAALSDFLGFSASICKYERPELSGLRLPVAKNRYKPAPLHVVTQSSVDRLSDIVDAPVEATRFRPNILLDGEDHNDFEENSWVGRTLRIGGATCFVTEPTARCGMTIVAQPGIAENADVLRSILRFNKRNFGAYCDIRSEGRISVGDEASIEFAGSP